MSTIQLTDDDVGKTGGTNTGDEIGIVSGYRYGTAYVDPDPGLKTTLLTKLGWEDTDADDGYHCRLTPTASSPKTRSASVRTCKEPEAVGRT